MPIITRVQDTFTAANGTNVAGHTTDTGGVWAGIGTSGSIIQSNKYQPVLFGDSRERISPSSVTADYTVAIDLTLVGASLNNCVIGVRFRDAGIGTDFGSCYEVAYDGGSGSGIYTTNSWSLVRWISSIPTVLNSSAMAWAAGTYTLQVICSGNNFTIQVNGSTLFTVTDSAWPSAGTVGIVSHGGSPVANFVADNFLVTETIADTFIPSLTQRKTDPWRQARNWIITN